MTVSTPLLNGITPPGNSFVVWDRKLVYMSVTKCACTTLRWMIADLAGEDFETFYEAPGGYASRLMTIHGPRANWRHTVQLSKLSPEQLEEISPDNGWFVFAVVRDPWSRFWSAWQSKFLLRATFYDQYRDKPWYPSLPTSQEQVIKDFRIFLDARPWTSDPVLSHDVHFLPQVHSVRPAGVNYTRVYDLTGLDELFTDLKSHLAAHGRPVENLFLPRANENPLSLIPAVLEDGVAESLQELYAPDFEEFGERWSLDRLTSRPGSWSKDALRHAEYRTVASERIGDLSREARKYKSQWRQETTRNNRLQAELAMSQGRAESTLSARVAARLAREAGRTRRKLVERIRA